MNKIFIFSLTDDIRTKNKVEYIYKDKKFNNKYMLEIILEENNFSKIICFGKPESSWDYLYEIMCMKYKNENIDLSNIEYLKEIKDIETVEEIFNKSFGNKISIKYIEKDYNNNDMIDYLYEFKEEISKYKNVCIDITGGLRTIPIMVLQLINLINKKNKNEINLEVIYGKDSGANTFKILELNDFVEKIDYIDSVSKFINYGNPKHIIKFFKDKQLKKEIENLYIYTQYNLVGNIVESLEKIVNNKNKKYTSFIQELVVESKLKEWNKIIKNDNLKDYQLCLENEALSIVSCFEEKKHKQSIKEMKKIRNAIVHPYLENSNILYEDIINFKVKYKKAKIVKKELEILITSLGNISIYKESNINLNDINIKSKFIFNALLANNKYDKIFLLGKYMKYWNDFIDEYIKEKNLKYERKYDYDLLINNKEEFNRKLNQELNSIDDRFCAILFENTSNVEDRNKYFEDMFKGIILTGNEKYNVTYDITHGFRDDSFITYINIYLLEILGYLKIKEIYYGEYNKLTKNTVLKNMNNILSITNLFKFINDFEQYNKYNEEIEINKDLKKVIKKISILGNYNQVNGLEKMREELENLNKYDNKIEKELLEHIKKTYIFKRKDKFGIFKNYIELQYNFGNLGLVIYLIWELFLYSTLKIENNQYLQYREKFLKNSNKYRLDDLKNYYNKYKCFSQIRKEIAHINKNKFSLSILDLENLIFEFLNDLENIKSKRGFYSKKFKDYLKKIKKDKV